MTTVNDPPRTTAGRFPGASMPDSDISSRRSLRLWIQLNADGDQLQGGGEWIDLTLTTDKSHLAGPRAQETIRVQATDLRDAWRKTMAARAEATPLGGTPAVLVDVEVVIGQDARSARKKLAQLDTALAASQRSPSVRYVGTPSGLAGLIVDIHALGIADGVALLPLTVPNALEQIVDEVLPLLGKMGFRAPHEQTICPTIVAGGRF